MEDVRILFARPLKLKQCDFLGFFRLPSKFNIGFQPRTSSSFLMSVHKEINSLWLTLVVFFNPNHFYSREKCVGIDHFC